MESIARGLTIYQNCFIPLSKYYQTITSNAGNRTISNDADNWKDNDASDYNKKTTLSLWEAIVETTLQGASIGSDIGSIFGKPGEILGKVVGSVAGLFFGGLRYTFGFKCNH